MIKYKAHFFITPSITTVEVVSETPKQLKFIEMWFGNKQVRSASKITSETGFFNTWEEAHKFLMDIAINKVSYARSSLERANSTLGNVKGMKKPEGGAA